MEQSQLMLNFDQEIEAIGAVKGRILKLWDSMEYNPYHRVGSIRKHLRHESMSSCNDIITLLSYEHYLIDKSKQP